MTRERDWLGLGASVLLVFVSLTNLIGPKGTTWETARGIAAVSMLILFTAWIFRWRTREGTKLRYRIVILGFAAVGLVVAVLVKS